jgi:hypothetical protein
MYEQMRLARSGLNMLRIFSGLIQKQGKNILSYKIEGLCCVVNRLVKDSEVFSLVHRDFRPTLPSYHTAYDVRRIRLPMISAEESTAVSDW